MPPLVQVENLSVHYPGAGSPIRAVDGMTFQLEAGETYALVGESGCGKTATGLAILRLVEPGRITGGRVCFDGRDLTALSEREMCKVRGDGIGMVFQEPAAALDPVIQPDGSLWGSRRHDFVSFKPRPVPRSRPGLFLWQCSPAQPLMK